MNVGDLVKWTQDDDMGIVIGIVGDFGEGSRWDDEDDAGNPIITWFGLGEVCLDTSVRSHDKDLEVISESR